MNDHSGPRPRTVCLLSLSAIADDPRVRRQGDAFHQHGWKVIGVGLAGRRANPPAWEVRDRSAGSNAASCVDPVRVGPGTKRLIDRFGAYLSRRPERTSVFGGLAWATVRLPQRPLARGWRATRRLAVLIRPGYALEIYWSRENVTGVWQRAAGARADVWIANDWATLPIAARLAEAEGGIVGYDTHELATSEYEQRLLWRVFDKPTVAAIERQFIGRASVVTAVSDGIAQRLQQLYPHARPAFAVKSTPAYQAFPFRPTGETVRLLYHGIIAPGRGLEASIDSVRLWNESYTLTLRGPGEPRYIAGLQSRIMRAGLGNRIAIAPPVLMTALVREAAVFDVGLFALPRHSQHNEFALPNKFFEYVMAGLALCVSDLSEMTRLVRHYDLGALIGDVSPEAIATAVISLDRVAIDRHKRAALTAAKTLCWEAQSGPMIEAYDRAVRETGVMRRGVA